MRKFLVLLAILTFAAPLAAQWRRAALFGADVRALIIDPAHPDTLYLGTSGGEVYVSNDGAKSWNAARNGVPFPGYVVDNLVIDLVPALRPERGRYFRRRCQFHVFHPAKLQWLIVASSELQMDSARW